MEFKKKPNSQLICLIKDQVNANESFWTLVTFLDKFMTNQTNKKD
jgi:hypothetical protein